MEFVSGVMTLIFDLYFLKNVAMRFIWSVGDILLSIICSTSHPSWLRAIITVSSPLLPTAQSIPT